MRDVRFRKVKSFAQGSLPILNLMGPGDKLREGEERQEWTPSKTWEKLGETGSLVKAFISLIHQGP